MGTGSWISHFCLWILPVFTMSLNAVFTVVIRHIVNSCRLTKSLFPALTLLVTIDVLCVNTGVVCGYPSHTQMPPCWIQPPLSHIHTYNHSIFSLVHEHTCLYKAYLFFSVLSHTHSRTHTHTHTQKHAQIRTQSKTVYKRWSHWPYRAVITASHSKRLFGMDVKSPELALTVALHDEQRLVSVPHHHLKDLTVLRPCQDTVRLPAHTPDGQPWARGRCGERKRQRGREKEGGRVEGRRRQRKGEADRNREKERERHRERESTFTLIIQ